MEGWMVDWTSEGKVTFCVVVIGGFGGFEMDELTDGRDSLPLSEVEADGGVVVVGTACVESGSDGGVDVFSRGTNAEPAASGLGLGLAWFRDCLLILRFEVIIWPEVESAFLFRRPRGVGDGPRWRGGRWWLLRTWRWSRWWCRVL